MKLDMYIDKHEPAIDSYEINDRIKKIREIFGLSQEEFASKIRLSNVTVYNIEAKITKVSVQTIALLYYELDVNIDYLLYGKDEPVNTTKKQDDELLDQYLGMTAPERVCLYKILQVLRKNPLYYDPYKDILEEQRKREDQENDDTSTPPPIPPF